MCTKAYEFMIESVKLQQEVFNALIIGDFKQLSEGAILEEGELETLNQYRFTLMIEKCNTLLTNSISKLEKVVDEVCDKIEDSAEDMMELHEDVDDAIENKRVDPYNIIVSYRYPKVDSICKSIMLLLQNIGEHKILTDCVNKVLDPEVTMDYVKEKKDKVMDTALFLKYFIEKNEIAIPLDSNASIYASLDNYLYGEVKDVPYMDIGHVTDEVSDCIPHVIKSIKCLKECIIHQYQDIIEILKAYDGTETPNISKEDEVFPVKMELLLCKITNYTNLVLSILLNATDICNYEINQIATALLRTKIEDISYLKK